MRSITVALCLLLPTAGMSATSFKLSNEEIERLLGERVPAVGATVTVREANPAVETGICFTEISSLGTGLRELSCKNKDAYVKAFGAAAIVLKGMAYTCVFVPHPGAQVGAKVFDVAGYAMGTISFSYSLAKCVNPEEEKIKALKSACYELKKNGVNCVAVGV